MPSERCFSRVRPPALRRYVADDLVVVLDSAQPNGGVWFPAIVRHADAAKRTCDVLVYLAERTRAADPAGAADGALAPGADGKVVSRRVDGVDADGGLAHAPALLRAARGGAPRAGEPPPPPALAKLSKADAPPPETPMTLARDAFGRVFDGARWDVATSTPKLASAGELAALVAQVDARHAAREAAAGAGGAPAPGARGAGAGGAAAEVGARARRRRARRVGVLAVELVQRAREPRVGDDRPGRRAQAREREPQVEARQLRALLLLVLAQPPVERHGEHADADERRRAQVAREPADRARALGERIGGTPKLHPRARERERESERERE